MARASLTIRVRLRWWFWPYFNTLAALCVAFDLEPDWERLEKMVRRAVRYEVVS